MEHLGDCQINIVHILLKELLVFLEIEEAHVHELLKSNFGSIVKIFLTFQFHAVFDFGQIHSFCLNARLFDWRSVLFGFCHLGEKDLVANFFLEQTLFEYFEETLLSIVFRLDEVAHKMIFEVCLLEDFDVLLLGLLVEGRPFCREEVVLKVNRFVEILIFLVDDVHHSIDFLGQFGNGVNLSVCEVYGLLRLHGRHHAIPDNRLLKPKVIGMKLDLGLLEFFRNNQSLLQARHFLQKPNIVVLARDRDNVVIGVCVPELDCRLV